MNFDGIYQLNLLSSQATQVRQPKFYNPENSRSDSYQSKRKRDNNKPQAVNYSVNFFNLKLLKLLNFIVN